VFARAGGRFGDETLFTANADGTNERRVSPFGKTCCERWSPDGTQISIAHLAKDGRRISMAVVDPDGSLVRILPLPPGTLNLGCGFSSAPGLLACEGWDEQHPERAGLYIRNTDGSGTHRIDVPPRETHDVALDISPDGKQVVFVRPTDEYHPVGPMFVENIDGTGLQRVTPEGIDVAYQARFSPDGRWILFAGAYWLAEGEPIWLVRPDGTGLHKVFEDPEGRSVATLTWLPDGTMILFGLGDIVPGDDHPPNALYVVRSDGTELTKIIDSPDFKREPDWVY
jgi:Tol biopolymer transport system component